MIGTNTSSWFKTFGFINIKYEFAYFLYILGCGYIIIIFFFNLKNSNNLTTLYIYAFIYLIYIYYLQQKLNKLTVHRNFEMIRVKILIVNIYIIIWLDIIRLHYILFDFWPTERNKKAIELIGDGGLLFFKNNSCLLYFR